MDSTNMICPIEALGSREPSPILTRLLGSLLLGCGGAFSLASADLRLLWIFVPLFSTLLFLTKARPSILFGAGLFFFGGLMVYNFSGILRENLPLLAVSLSLAGAGALSFSRGVGGGSVLVILFTMVYGMVGWLGNASLGSGGVTGVYDPVEEGRAVFLFTEPCFIVDNGEGEVRLVPGGKWGIYPEHPSPAHVGKRIGNDLIIGIVEKGGEINIYNPGGQRMAVLDFSFVTPAASDKSAVVVSELF